MHKFISIVIFAIFLFATECSIAAQPSKQDQLSLTQPEASHFASLALKCVRKEYPNKLDHTINDKDDVRNPRAMHPAFYGCFDWHSTVHGHWMLLHLLKAFPAMPEAKEIRRAQKPFASTAKPCDRFFRWGSGTENRSRTI